MTVQAQVSVQYFDGPIAKDATLNITDFSFLDNSHVSAKIRGASSNWTYSTDYTVSGAGGSGGTLTVKKTGGVATGETLAVFLTVPITQNIAPEEGGNLPASTVEYTLDKLTYICQDLSARVTRAVQASMGDQFTGTINITKDKIGYGFVVGGTESNLQIAFTPHKVSELDTMVTRVYSSADNIDAVANDLTNINSVVNNETNIDTVAGSVSSVNTVAGSITNVNNVASDITNIDSVANKITKVETVANNIDNVNAVGNSITDVNNVADDLTNINAVAANATNINTVATNIANVNAVGNSIANVNTVVNSLTDIATNATNIASINTNASNIVAIQNASTNAIIAQQSAASAKQWAIGDPTEPTEGSAKYWAGQAASGQVQSDWNETDSTKKSFIQNKDLVENVLAEKLNLSHISVDPTLGTRNSNVNITGTLTDNNGVLSGFSATNYATLPIVFDPERSSWEIVRKVITGSSTTGEKAQVINGNNSGKESPFLCITPLGYLQALISISGTDWDINMTSVFQPEANTTYWFKVSFNGSRYSLSTSLDGNLYTEVTGYNSSGTIYPELTPAKLGINDANDEIFNGSIDLNGCYDKIGTTKVWEGISVGASNEILPSQKAVLDYIGNKNSLTTTTKTNLVAAINEVDAAVDTKQDIIQYATMPEASAAWLNKPVQYIGETTTLTYKWNTITYTSGLDADKPATGYYKATDTSLWYKDGVDITDVVGDYTGDLPTPDATQVGKYKYNTETTVLSNCVVNTLPFTHAYIYEVEASTTTPVTYSWKQKDIQPHQSIKTINNKSLVGTGNIATYTPNLFDFKWSDHLLNDESWTRGDTFSWQSGTTYSNCYNELLSEYNAQKVDLYAYADTGSNLVYTTTETPTVDDNVYGGSPNHLLGTITAIDTDTITYNSVVYTRTSASDKEDVICSADDTIYYVRTTKGYKIADSTQESVILSKYNTSGIAWYYILDTTNTRFKLPRTKFGFEGLRDNVGDNIQPKLPNINAVFTADVTDYRSYVAMRAGSNGAFSWKVRGKGLLEPSSSSVTINDFSELTFNAHNSNAIYEDGATVQEPSTQMYLYFYVGEFTQTATEQTAGLNAELFNGKLDINASNLSATGQQIFDGQWQNANNYSLYNGSINGSTALEITIPETVIPNDGKNYEIELNYVHRYSSSYGSSQLMMTSDYFGTYDNSADAFYADRIDTTTNNGTIVLPIGASHKIYIRRTTNYYNAQLFIKAFKRLGTNP